MVDYIKITNTGLTTDQLQNKELLSFTERYNTLTGEIIPGSRLAKFKDLYFSVGFTGFIGLSGSLHKFHNGGIHNYDDFCYSKLVDSVGELKNKFGIIPRQAMLNNVEFGVNIEVPYNPDVLLRNLVLHRNKQFNYEETKKMFCSKVKYAQYHVKLYNKGLQYNLPRNILRFEVKIIRMAKIAKFEIHTLADLLSKAKLLEVKQILLDAFDDIIFYDKSVDCSTLKPKDIELITNGGNPKFWKAHYEETGSNAIKKVRQYQSLIREHGSLNLNSIRHLINDKWDDLVNDNNNNIRDFTELQLKLQSGNKQVFTTPGEILSEKKIRKITGLLTMDAKQENEHITNSNNLSIDKDLVSESMKRRECIVTGLDISMQKESSRFLSISGIRFLFEHDRDQYNKLLSELPSKWHNDTREVQEYKIAHHIRDKFFNLRNSTRRAIKKKCEEKALFDNRTLISKGKLAIANTP